MEQKYIYLLSLDGYRDSVALDKCSMDIIGLKKHLIQEQKELFENTVLLDSITIEDNEREHWLIFKYIDIDGDIEDGRCGFFKLSIIQS